MADYLLICNVAKEDEAAVNFLLTYVYDNKRYVNLAAVEKDLEDELLWSLDDRIPTTEVISYWVSTLEYPRIAITTMSEEYCVELLATTSFTIKTCSWKETLNVTNPF